MSESATVEEGTLLEVRDLAVQFPEAAGGRVAAVDGVSFEVGRREAVGLLGESGCGKTTTALAVLGLLPPGARLLRGTATFRGTDLIGLDERRLQRIRGASISFLFQEPAIALNPVLRAGDQVVEVARAHLPWTRRRCREEAEALLVRLGLPQRAYGAYPHELSGGQRQRVAIAQAIVCGPALMIADEPTTALDPLLRAEVLGLLVDLKERFGLALLVISHDLASVIGVADRVLVMYAGRIVEDGPVADVCGDPLHPYTRGLLASLTSTRRGDPARGRRLPTLPGGPPDLSALPSGCAFEPRCPDRMEECLARAPGEVRPRASRRVRCFKHGG